MTDKALTEEVARVIEPLAWLIKGTAQDNTLTALLREQSVNMAVEVIRLVREHDGDVTLPHRGRVS